MEEADILGDKIGIMAQGRMVRGVFLYYRLLHFVRTLLTV